ncbi:MAG: NAD(P)-dependent glycerol-3-phosphate dehydrogenase [Bacteroidetes bacterium]|nr:NAD(P)-dependent glycerol-3-phosphate dehydrogenase [Bacteroidota bacterium]
MKKNIAVVGAGGWGTALAMVLSQKTDVLLWCYERETADEIELNRTNKDFLPGVELPENIMPCNDINELKKADIIINTVPTQHIRSVYSQIKFSFEDKIIVNGAKGIEQTTLLRVSEIFNEILNIQPNNYVVLTGPSHAEEVSRNVPTAVVTASANIELAKYIRDFISTKTFRAYSSDDVVGCELGGALKNVIAIAFGIAEGLKLGDNTKAIVITRGLAEIIRLGNIYAAKTATICGLSGLGDLVVTCNSKYSRNRSLGELLARGGNINKVQNKVVVEGVGTTNSAYLLANKIGITLPITEQVYNVIYNGLDVNQAVLNLLDREIKNEVW